MSRWLSLSTQFLADPKVEELGEHHGSAGPLVIIALLGRAKIANDGGRVNCSLRTVAHEAFTDRETVAAVLELAEKNGLIQIEVRTATEASVRFPAFSRWQEAGRKAQERATRKLSANANVRTRPEVSGAVPTDTTDTTDTTDRQTKKKASGKPSEFDAWLTHYRRVTGRDSVRGSKPARRAFLARRRDGYSLEDLQAATVGCHSDAWNRERGFDVPETILRADKVTRYIALGRKAGPRPLADYDANTEVIAV